MLTKNHKTQNNSWTKSRLFSHKKLGRLLLLCIALCLMAACSKPVMHAPDTPAPPTQVSDTWQAYEHYTQVMESHHAPYRISSSIRYDSRGNGHRLLVYMWSNDEYLPNKNISASSPLRLDVVAGIGATVAQVREDASSFIMYSPNEKKVYYHQGSRKPLFSLGVPVPFSLAELTDLMLGRFGNVFGTSFNTQKNHEPTLEPHGEIAYTIKDRGYLVVSQDGLVHQWCQEDARTPTKSAKRGWVLDILYADPQSTVSEGESTQIASSPSQLPLPRKLSFTYYGPKGIDHTAVVLVKERQNPDQSFTPEQVELQIPQGTPFYPLQNEQ